MSSQLWPTLYHTIRMVNRSIAREGPVDHPNRVVGVRQALPVGSRLNVGRDSVILPKVASVPHPWKRNAREARLHCL